jgi:hypothetical protein
MIVWTMLYASGYVPLSVFTHALCVSGRVYRPPSREHSVRVRYAGTT